MFRENFKGVQEQGGEFVEVPAGIYLVTVKSATEKRTKTSGLNMIVVKFSVMEGEYKDSPLWDNIVFHENMKGRNKHILKVLHLPCEDDAMIDASEWVDRELRVRIRVRYNEYRKRLVSEITQYLYFTEEEEQEEKEKKAKAKGKIPFTKEEDPPLQKEVPAEEKGGGEDEVPF